jgi:hypothetical protein
MGAAEPSRRDSESHLGHSGCEVLRKGEVHLKFSGFLIFKIPTRARPRDRVSGVQRNAKLTLP